MERANASNSHLNNEPKCMWREIKGTTNATNASSEREYIFFFSAIFHSVCPFDSCGEEEEREREKSTKWQKHKASDVRHYIFTIFFFFCSFLLDYWIMEIRLNEQTLVGVSGVVPVLVIVRIHRNMLRIMYFHFFYISWQRSGPRARRAALSSWCMWLVLWAMKRRWKIRRIYTICRTLNIENYFQIEWRSCRSVCKRKAEKKLLQSSQKILYSILWHRTSSWQEARESVCEWERERGRINCLIKMPYSLCLSLSLHCAELCICWVVCFLRFLPDRVGHSVCFSFFLSLFHFFLFCVAPISQCKQVCVAVLPLSSVVLLISFCCNGPFRYACLNRSYRS